MSTAVMTAADLVCRLRAHYLPPPRTPAGVPIAAEQLLPGAVLLTEVPSEAGRRIDALVIGLTKSRQGLDGFEIKVSRGDWLAELGQPAKADPWYAATHRWWIAAPSTAVVSPQELPAGWGLMVPDPRGRGMKILVKADTRTPSLDWPVLWEIVKKLDRGRAAECAAMAEQIRLQLTAQARERMNQLELPVSAAHADHAAIGAALAEITGVPLWRLRRTLDDPPPWLSNTLRAVFAVDERGTAATFEEATRHTERLASQHEQALGTLRHVLQVLADPAGDTHRAVS
jgi:hypothetical protein